MFIYRYPETLDPAMERRPSRPAPRHPRQRVAGLVAITIALAAPTPVRGGDADAAPPDLRLEWVIDGRRVRTPDPIRGTAGEVLRLDYEVLNVGGAPAFAAVLSVTTTLGPLPGSRRLQPGPQPGERIRSSLRLSLSAGVRQVCVQARLQTARATDPGDPHLEDNLLCRDVIVRDDDHTAPPARHAPTRTTTGTKE